MKHLETPLTKTQLSTLSQGDIVLLSGVIYTARDAAHKRITSHFAKTGVMLLKGEIVYHAGPCPNKPNQPIGSIGPTTSCRMDTYSDIFLKNGCLYSIGKGERSDETKQLIHTYGGVHFLAVGGAGAYYKNCVKKAEVAFFPELGAEAVYCLTVENFPLIVGII